MKKTTNTILGWFIVFVFGGLAIGILALTMPIIIQIKADHKEDSQRLDKIEQRIKFLEQSKGQTSSP